MLLFMQVECIYQDDCNLLVCRVNVDVLSRQDASMKTRCIYL